MMDLEKFISIQKEKPQPSPNFVDGSVVERYTDRGETWTAEALTADAFNQGVLSTKSDSWESGLRKVRDILKAQPVPKKANK